MLSVQSIIADRGQSGIWLTESQICRFASGDRYLVCTTRALSSVSHCAVWHGDFLAAESAGLAFVVDTNNPAAIAQAVTNSQQMVHWVNTQIFARYQDPFLQGTLGPAVAIPSAAAYPLVPRNITLAEYEAAFYDYFCYSTVPGSCDGYAAVQNNLLFAVLLRFASCVLTSLGLTAKYCILVATLNLPLSPTVMISFPSAPRNS